jgi:Flp pilus assembly protein TadD
MGLDNENPDVRQNLGMRLFGSRRYNEAIPYLESAAAIGRAPSSELSYLATAKSLSGDPSAAEETMATAASLYPRSPFVLARYATLLEANGKTAESSAVFERAVKVDRDMAKTWRLLIDSGPKALGEMAARDRRYSDVMGLSPRSAIYAVVTERLIRHPEEEKFSFGKLFKEEE